MNAGLSVKLQPCSVRLGTVSLLYLCAYAVTGEVDIQSAAEFHPVLHPTNIHCAFTIQQSLQQVLYVYHLIPPLLITLPDICLRSQNKPEFKSDLIPILELFTNVSGTFLCCDKTP